VSSGQKAAVVTGGASGIGRACVVAFAEEGARVAIADADGDAAEKAVELARACGGDAFFVLTDVSSADEMERFFAQVDERFGRLDFAVNAAGIQGTLAETADCTVDNWARTIGVNLTGVFLAMKHEIKAMLRGDGGAIVNIASNFGLVGSPRMPAYAASKHGVVGLSKVAGLEYATRGVRINALCPGGTDTPLIQKTMAADPAAGERMMEEVMALHPMRRLARPEEIAAAALWLCSDGASYVSGASIAVDGGFVAQ
jgi:NAD(P)-dependent dehydrogenase (short-subunit alcohol dehydrogenase family)